MLMIIWGTQFKKDYKIAVKRKKDLEKLLVIVKELQLGNPLPQKNKNHKLKGNYSGNWECHIEPDWLLVYELTKTELILVRTGTHADLF